MDEAKTAVLMEQVCTAYGLGALTLCPTPVRGGLQHQLWRVQTDVGAFAVKALNPRLLSSPESRTAMERGEQIAQAASRAGLPAVVALHKPNGFIQDVSGIAVLVFPWHEGITLPATAATSDAACQIGEMLGRLHRLNTPIPGLEPPRPQHFPDAHWNALSAQGQGEGAPWASAITAGLPALHTWNEATRTAETALGRNWVATHRDLDQKNVLWADGEIPWLLDWEAGGAMAPALEVMGTALNWAGQSAEPPEATTFAAFLDGYRSATIIGQDQLRHAAQAVLGKWLVWLEWNLHRSLPSMNGPLQERDLAVDAVNHAFQTLERMWDETPTRLAWCD